MTNLELKNIFQAMWLKIKSAQQITICTHINSDGDTIGSSLALKYLILKNLPNKQVKISGEKYPRYLNFLENNDLVNDNFFYNSLHIVVDTSTKKRIFDQRIKTKNALKIDHHAHEGQWLLAIGGDHWPATGELIYLFSEMLNLQRSNEIDEALFVAIWTDTEGMTQRNISAQTKQIMHKLVVNRKALLAKMKLNKQELTIIKQAQIKVDGIVSYAISDTPISNDFYRQYVNYIYQQSNTEIILVGTPMVDYYRFGLRSKGKINVVHYAKMIGGGGHATSAGFIIKQPRSIMTTKIKHLIKEINRESRIKKNN